MESESDNSSEQDTATVPKELEEPSEKQKRRLWWKEENWPTLKKAMERQRNQQSLECVMRIPFLDKQLSNIFKLLAASRSHF